MHIRVVNETNSPLIGPNTGINTEIKCCCLIFFMTNQVQQLGFWLFPRVMEGFGISGELVGTISIYPGTVSARGNEL